MAVTRARESLYLLNYSQKPESKGKVTQVKPSMFLKEMNPEFAEGDLRHFKAGMSVNHKTLEAGIVVSKTLFFVNIHFENGNKIFPIKLTKKPSLEAVIFYWITNVNQYIQVLSSYVMK